MTQNHLTVRSYCKELETLLLLLSLHLISLRFTMPLHRACRDTTFLGLVKPIASTPSLEQMTQGALEVAAASIPKELVPLLILAGVDELHQNELLHVFMEDVFQSPTPFFP